MTRSPASPSPRRATRGTSSTSPVARSLRMTRALALLVVPALVACGGRQSQDLAIDRVVLYQSGVAYIERTGEVSGDVLTMTVRPDQINDLLASLAVRDERGSTVTVSFPVDPRPDPRMPGLPDHAVGSGGIGALLEAFRGATVRATTPTQHVRGRIVSVDRADGDARLTLFTSGSELVSLALDDIQRVEIVNDGLALALERALDRRLADGDWKAVDISVRFADSNRRRVAVSYVLEAPTWKPAYRAIVDDNGLRLQGWAVVDNVSGDDWRDVQLSLTSGTPISFRYDLHAPVFVDRPDLSGYNTPSVADLRPPTPMRATPGGGSGYGAGRAGGAPPPPAAVSRQSARPSAAPAPAPRAEAAYGYADMAMEAEESWAYDESGAGMALAGGSADVVELGALYRYDIPGRVSLPDQSSTLVSLLDERFDGDEALVFQPGLGSASSVHPYRALRFTNGSPTPIEAAPITIYRQGTFVGEGLLPVVSPGERAFVPYTIERRVQVTQRRSTRSGDVTLRRIVNGRITVERETHDVTTVELSSSLDATDTVFVRVPRTQDAELIDPPPNTETQTDVWLVPVPVAPNGRSSVDVTTRTRRQEALAIEDQRLKPVLDVFLARPDLRPDLAAALRPIQERLDRIAEIDRQLAEQRQLRAELQNRTAELRANLQSLGQSAEGAQLRETLRERLGEQESRLAQVGTVIVALSEEQATLRVTIAEELRAISFDEPAAR